MSVSTRQSIEDLLKAVNDASGSARGLFITLMVLALYFLIVVSGTDDLALLRNATVAVPTLSNATLPARAFYMCAPLIFVFLHLDLLIHLKLLSDKLYRYNELLETSGMDEATVRDYRLRLAGFPFSNWLGSDPRTGRIAYALQGAIVWITLVLLPLAVLLAMQLGFLAYQSEAVTWLHRGALIVDAGLLLYFWEAFQRGRYRPPDVVRTLFFTMVGEAVRPHIAKFRLRRRQVRSAQILRCQSLEGDRRVAQVVWRALPALRKGAIAIGLPLSVAMLLAAVLGLWGSGYLLLSIMLAILCVIVGARIGPLPSSFMLALRQTSGDLLFASLIFTARRWPVFIPVTFVLPVALTIATIPDEAADHTSRWLYSWMEGSTKDSNLVSDENGLSSSDLDAQIAIVIMSLGVGRTSTDAKSSALLAGARCTRWLSSMMPGMPASDESLSDSKHEGSALAFHLENANRMPRNLRASCPTIALFHLKGSWFHRTLSVTGLVVARSDVKPDQAKELRASLREFRSRAMQGERADAKHIDRYADLVTQLEGLDLSDRSLRWANFKDVVFPKGVLNRAQLQHARLELADLRNVDLNRATLTHASMNGVTLAGADLNGATLTDANMRYAMLPGADMSYATLTAADLSGATLTGAVMRYATLTAADLSGATLTAANMRYAKLAAADLSGATLTAADMRDTVLTGADLSCDVALPGARPICAILTGTNMRGATLTGADMRGATAKGALFPIEPERRRWLLVEKVVTGRYSMGDIEREVLELERLGTHDVPGRALPLEPIANRLIKNIGQPTSPDDFPDCIGGAPCFANDANQRQSAMDRTVHFEQLICGMETSLGAPVVKASDLMASALLSRLAFQETELQLANSIEADNSVKQSATATYLWPAAKDVLHRLATRRCASPEAQAFIDDWARRNPPPAKEPKL